MQLHRVGAYPYDLGMELPEVLKTVPEGASLFGAAGGIVLGIEVENHRLLTKEVSQAHYLSRLRREREVRSQGPRYYFVPRSKPHLFLLNAVPLPCLHRLYGVSGRTGVKASRV